MFEIGIVIHDFKLGGSERIAIRLANYWHSQGHKVIVFCGSRIGEMRELLSPNVQIVCAVPAIARRRGSPREVGIAARSFFSKCNVDFCYIPGNYHWPVTYEMSRMAKPFRPILVTQISSLIYKPGRSYFSQAAFNMRMKLLIKKSDIIVALDGSTARECDLILNRKDTKVIPLPALSAQVTRPVSPPTNYKALAVGRLTEQKGFDTLIKAFRLVVDRLPNAHLNICGEGELRSYLENMIRELDLMQNITLLGYRDEVWDLLEESSIFVLSSRREGYGAVLLEALAAGRFIVTTNCTPAISDIFSQNGHLGEVVKVDNVLEISKAIIKNLSTVPDICNEVEPILRKYRIDYGAGLYLNFVKEYKRERSLSKTQLVPEVTS
ncbi:glycosyltransferase [Acetobacter pasteurianus]|uniref:Lipopolysaccharide core biosynthesis protein WbcM n=1 Tax=Acetobacter pasteurianus NBRC 3188 TaxID=1226663 RepID=A0A401WXN8_ACEPA|nr:glycosyltransferase [Acetobacter pasteurianus]GCD54076.1 lipopolysaccharide core biosynthesis protein WbcM [Acetobacter pasteurianus NBRC 3188]